MVAPLLAFGVLIGIAASVNATPYGVTSLTTDDNANLTELGFPAAANIDPNLINPWGISFGPATPFWVSDNGTGVSTLYTAAGVPTGGPLVVTIADAASPAAPTGQVFNNNTSNFNISGCSLAPPSCSANFIFDTENGTISGRSNTFNRTQSFIEVNSSTTGAVYKGLAIATPSGSSNNVIYAANFNSGMVEEYNSSWGLVRTFTDPSLPSGYAPFNVQLLNGNLYVTFAVQDAAKHDDVAGAGNGFVDVFNLNGNFLERLIDPGGVLNSAWGLAIAPAGFGDFAGDLLVGNFGNGEIDAFSPTTSNDFLGTLDASNGDPLVIPGLWDLTIGNAGPGVNPNAIYFTAGLPSFDDPTLLEQHGLFGSISPIPEPSSLPLLAAGLAFLGVRGFGTHWRRQASRRPAT